LPVIRRIAFLPQIPEGSGLYDDKGTLNNYYVDTNLFHQSIHRSVTCIGCHSDISKVPHGEVEHVDWCQDLPPGPVCGHERRRIFPTRRWRTICSRACHGVKPDDPPEVVQLKPDCKYCHLNDLYTLPEELAHRCRASAMLKLPQGGRSSLKSSPTYRTVSNSRPAALPWKL